MDTSENNKSKALWTFSEGDDSTFIAPNADQTSRLYFPLMNSAEMKSWVTPELKGDICSSFSHYLTPPTITEEIQKTNSSRNCWVSIDGKKPWSATGMSSWQKAERWVDSNDNTIVEGDTGLFTLKRENTDLKIASEIKVFVPETNDHVELMIIEIENKDNITVSLDVTYSIPLFGRHADNFRDHRQVTTMFQRNFIEDYGVRIKPNIVHDEHGHAPNNKNYIVAGTDEKGNRPEQIWVSMADFIGEGGNLENPESVFKHLNAPKYSNGEADGREAIGAFRFSKVKIKPNEKFSYIIIQGISDNETEMSNWKEKYGDLKKAKKVLDKTLKYWHNYTGTIKYSTPDTDFVKWSRWVIYQVKARQVYGNSFLPDFGYGRGGRGWRDLWQDLLSIFLVDPESARTEILNNFKGVRIDGSNATIIGSKSGEFIADRNNVARSWCDHGAWPAFVLNFYIQQTGDYDILFEQLPYWKDQFTSRTKVLLDKNWNNQTSKWQLDNKQEIYKGSVFEHILIQQLSAFYNVGEHNILLLEGADWNDTYDMAREKGESIGFYGFYSKNLKDLVGSLKELLKNGVKHIDLLDELIVLLDRLPSQQDIDYSSAEAKQNLLNVYFDIVRFNVKGERTSVNIENLILDLDAKSNHISELISDQEWIVIDSERGYFNGHYDNLGEAVDGQKETGIQMDLTTQVMSIMHGIASEEQILKILNAAGDFLQDDKSKGYRLCKPFKNLDLNLGRLTGFVYGYKEHGSKWMQQNIMLAYGLFTQNFSSPALDVIQDVYQLSTNSGVSKIFPGVPSYFEPGDRGAYAYLSGSSAWLILTLTTQLFGVRGENGNLCLDPKLNFTHFDFENKTSIQLTFRNKVIQVNYMITDDTSNFVINELDIDGHRFIFPNQKENKVIILKEDFDKLTHEGVNIINVTLV